MSRRLFAVVLTLAACSQPGATVPDAPVVRAAAPAATPTLAAAPTPAVATPAATPRPTTFPTPPPLSAVTPAPPPSAAATPAWRRYSSPAGPAIYLPGSWVVVDPALYDPSVSFAAAPVGATVPLGQQPVLAAIHVIRRRDRPFVDAADLADTVQAEVPGLDGAERTTARHPSGTAVVLKYPLRIGTLPLLLEADALFVRDGVGIILGMRAPVDRMDDYADAFEEMFSRFRL